MKENTEENSYRSEYIQQNRKKIIEVKRLTTITKFMLITVMFLSTILNTLFNVINIVHLVHH